jgi:hypothetical protein
VSIVLDKDYICGCRTSFKSCGDLNTHARKLHHAVVLPATHGASEASPEVVTNPPMAFITHAGQFPSLGLGASVVAGTGEIIPAFATTILHRHSLVLHSTGHLICLICLEGVFLSNLIQHTDNHSGPRPITDQVRNEHNVLHHVVDDLKRMGILQNYRNDKPPRPAPDRRLNGLCAQDASLLPPESGYRCTGPQCNFAFQAKSNNGKHLHNGQHFTTVACLAQTVFSAPNAHWFPVGLPSGSSATATSDPPSRKQLSLSYADRLQAILKVKIHQKSNWRSINFLVELCRWMQSLADIITVPALLHKVEDLRKLPDPNSNDSDYAYVRVLCHTLLQYVATFVRKASTTNFPHQILRTVQYVSACYRTSHR